MIRLPRIKGTWELEERTLKNAEDFVDIELRTDEDDYQEEEDEEPEEEE